MWVICLMVQVIFWESHGRKCVLVWC